VNQSSVWVFTRSFSFRPAALPLGCLQERGPGDRTILASAIAKMLHPAIRVLFRYPQAVWWRRLLEVSAIRAVIYITLSLNANRPPFANRNTDKHADTHFLK
jgi:hypothetical protein